MLGVDVWIQVIAIVAFTSVAAVIDFRSRRIPNWITVPAALGGLLFHVTNGALTDGWWGGWNGLTFSLGGFAVGFGILLCLMLIGLGGAGDVKLMGAVGTWLGFKYTIAAYVAAVFFAVGGLVMVSCWTVATRGLDKAKQSLNEGQTSTITPGRRKASFVTFALPVALGTWGALICQILVFNSKK